MKAPLFLFLVCLVTGCNQQKPQTLEEEKPAELVASEVTIEEDTTVYDMPYKTAVIEDANEYFRKNNKYKDWDKGNKKNIIVRAIIEKDSTASNIQVMSKDIEYPELKEEAIRLIQGAKIRPALNEKGEKVRSNWLFVMQFPPK